MLVSMASRLMRHHKAQAGPSHSEMREDHLRRKRQELCAQLRHQQYFIGYTAHTECS